MTAPQRNRTRSRDNRFSLSRSWENYLGSTSTSACAKGGGQYQEMSDVVTPNFFETMKKGGILMNRMSSMTATMTGASTSDLKIQTNPGAMPEQWSKYKGQNQCFYTGHGINSVGDYWKTSRYNCVTPDEAHKLDAEVCTRTLSSIGRSNTDMWENLAEVGKTVQMVKTILKRYDLRKLFAQVPPGQHVLTNEKLKRKSKKGVKSAADQWLEFRYGIRPLVSSIDAVMKNLKDNTRSSQRHTTRQSGTISRSLNDTFVTTNTYWSHAYFTVERQRTESLTVRAMSIDEAINDWSWNLGLTSKSLLTLPWELIPYSFVADWFVNAGSFIGALSQSLYPSSLGQCRVYQTVFSEYRRCAGTTSFSPGYLVIVEPAQGWVRTDIIWKDRYPGLLGPSLVFKSNFGFDEATRVGDSVALIGQKLMQHFIHRR